MTFEKYWYDLEYDDQWWEEDRNEITWNASRMNLSTCESCKYWKKFDWNKDVGACTNTIIPFKVGGMGTEELRNDVDKNFGCIFHSELENLK